jgi:hypothetical protein
MAAPPRTPLPVKEEIEYASVFDSDDSDSDDESESNYPAVLTFIRRSIPPTAAARKQNVSMLTIGLKRYAAIASRHVPPPHAFDDSQDAEGHRFQQLGNGNQRQRITRPVQPATRMIERVEQPAITTTTTNQQRTTAAQAHHAPPLLAALFSAFKQALHTTTSKLRRYLDTIHHDRQPAPALDTLEIPYSPFSSSPSTTTASHFRTPDPDPDPLFLNKAQPIDIPPRPKARNDHANEQQQQQQQQDIPFREAHANEQAQLARAGPLAGAFGGGAVREEEEERVGAYLAADTDWVCCACSSVNTRWEFLCWRCREHSKRGCCVPAVEEVDGPAGWGVAGRW